VAISARDDGGLGERSGMSLDEGGLASYGGLTVGLTPTYSPTGLVTMRARATVPVGDKKVTVKAASIPRALAIRVMFRRLHCT
jgi:hypothetical protein